MMHGRWMRQWRCFAFVSVLLILCFFAPYFSMSEPVLEEVFFSEHLSPPEDIVLMSAFSGGESGAFGAPEVTEGIVERMAYVALGYKGICKAVFLMDENHEDEVLFSGTNLRIDPNSGEFIADKPGKVSITAIASNTGKKDTWHFEVIAPEVLSIGIHGCYSTTYVGDYHQAFILPVLSIDKNLSWGSGEIIDTYLETHSKVRWSGTNIDIDPETGEWHAVKAGKATIRAELVSNSNVFATFTMMISPIARIVIIDKVNDGFRNIEFSAMLVLENGTTHVLPRSEYTVFTSENLVGDSSFVANAQGDASITVIYKNDESIRDTWEFTVNGPDPFLLPWSLKTMMPVGITDTIRLENTGAHWDATCSLNLTLSGLEDNEADFFSFTTVSEGDAWIEVTVEESPITGKPATKRIDFEVIPQVLTSLEITSVTIDGITYTGKASFPPNVNAGSTIIPQVTLHFDNGLTRVLDYSGSNSSLVFWTCSTDHITSDGIRCGFDANDEKSILSAKYFIDEDIEDSWEFYFTGPVGISSARTFYDGPLRMYVGDVMRLDEINKVLYRNMEDSVDVSQFEWEIIPYSVEAEIINGSYLKATKPGMIWVRQRSVQNPQAVYTSHIWAETPCCSDYKSCPACLESPDFHNSAYCVCKHNFPFYCPLCKGPCKKYLKSDANGYFHTLVGTSLQSVGTIGVGTLEVRELRIPQGAKATCCKNPCPACLYSETNCSGNNCTCGHDFPKWCPICKGSCKSYRAFGPDEMCHYVAENGQVKSFSPAPLLDPLPLTGQNVCDVCQKYRVVGARSFTLTEEAEFSLYAGSLACKCKPMFPAYCPYCLGPCGKATVIPNVNEYHYFSYKPDYTDLFIKYKQGKDESVMLTGAVIRRFIPVLPSGFDVTFTAVPSQNSSLDPRSAMKASFLSQNTNPAHGSQDLTFQDDLVESIASASSAVRNGQTSSGKSSNASVSNPHSLWLGGEDAAFFANTVLIGTLEKELGIKLSISAVAGQDLAVALQKALVSANQPDAVLLPVFDLLVSWDKWVPLDSLIGPDCPNLLSAIKQSKIAALYQDKADSLLFMPMPSLHVDDVTPLDENSLALAICESATSEERAAFIHMMEYLYTQKGRSDLQQAAGM